MTEEFTAAVEALERSGRLRERCSEPFVRFLPVTGASVSTLGDVLGSETLSATDIHAAHLDEVQFDLGEGPCWDAMRTSRPVAEPALRVRGTTRWPAFAGAIRDDPVSSIFAFPLTVGPLKLGAVDLYSREPIELDADATGRASTLAGIISRHVLRDALALSAPIDDVDTNPRSRRTIHQATGVVLAQLGMSPDEALLLIQGHAFAIGRPMMDVAAEIVDGTLTFRSRRGEIEVAQR